MKKLIILIIILSIAYLAIPSVKKFDIELSALTIPKSIETSRNSSLKSCNVKNYKLTVNTDLRIKSNLEEKDYKKMLEGTALENIGVALVKAENTYNVNGLYLMRFMLFRKRLSGQVVSL